MLENCLNGKKIYIALTGIILFISGNIYWRQFKLYDRKLKEERMQKEKNRAILNMFSKWLQNKNSGKAIETYLDEIGIRTVAIYGMSDAGLRLYDELKDTDIKLVYGIDKRVIDMEDEFPIMSVDAQFPEVDLIIVTAIYDFDEILKMLKHRVKCKIISLEQIVCEL